LDKGKVNGKAIAGRYGSNRTGNGAGFKAGSNQARLDAKHLKPSGEGPDALFTFSVSTGEAVPSPVLSPLYIAAIE